MSLTKRMFVVVLGATLLAVALGETVGAQNPPARGMRWTKAAPFPEPEEELYGTVINGKFYVVGGFGFNVPGAAPPAGARGAAGAPAANAGRGAAATNVGPCGGCPPGFVYEY